MLTPATPETLTVSAVASTTRGSDSVDASGAPRENAAGGQRQVSWFSVGSSAAVSGVEVPFKWVSIERRTTGGEGL